MAKKLELIPPGEILLEEFLKPFGIRPRRTIDPVEATCPVSPSGYCKKARSCYL